MWSIYSLKDCLSHNIVSIKIGYQKRNTKISPNAFSLSIYLLHTNCLMCLFQYFNIYLTYANQWYQCIPWKIHEILRLSPHLGCMVFFFANRFGSQVVPPSNYQINKPWISKPDVSEFQDGSGSRHIVASTKWARFTDGTFKRIIRNENHCIWIYRMANMLLVDSVRSYFRHFGIFSWILMLKKLICYLIICLKTTLLSISDTPLTTAQ